MIRRLFQRGYRGTHRAGRARPSYLTHVGAIVGESLLSPFRTPMALDMWADAT
jgi:hypothetical protein